jgi:Domain of unknown function (DUF4249)
MRFFIPILSALIILSGCQDHVKLNFSRVDKRLVVEGTITNNAGANYINLSYSAKYTYQPDAAGAASRTVTGAFVSVSDDSGNRYIFKENSPGLYVSDSAEFKGTVGRSYVLHINTPDGKIYGSKAERLNAAVTIDSLYYEHISSEDWLYIDFQDPASLGNYYQWRITFDGNQNDWIDIAPDDYFNGKYLKRFSKDHGNYARGTVIGIDQLSITKRKYIFLYTLDQQLRNGGTPFDAPSSTIVGNVYNEKDSADYALGYFGASAVSSKSIIIK